MVGTLRDWKADKVSNYFKGLVVTQTKDCVAKFIVDNKISVMDIASKLDEISRNINDAITGEFSRFGLEIVNLFVMSINVPDDDPSVLKIQEIMASRAELEQLGEYYKVKRTFDTLEKAAENEGGAVGALLSGGLGVGMGVGAGVSMGANLGSLLSTQSDQHNALNESNSQSPEEKLVMLKTLLEKGLISQDEFNEKRKKIIDAI
jgi:membrane protease subunit (stomatin/prohibitin family)